MNPRCGKLLSAPRFRLKGEGWYETDFKKDNQKNVHKADSAPASADKKSDDAKPAKKADKKSEATTKE